MSAEYNKMARMVYCRKGDLDRFRELGMNYPDACIQLTRVNCSD